MKKKFKSYINELIDYNEICKNLNNIKDMKDTINKALEIIPTINNLDRLLHFVTLESDECFISMFYVPTKEDIKLNGNNQFFLLRIWIDNLTGKRISSKIFTFGGKGGFHELSKITEGILYNNSNPDQIKISLYTNDYKEVAPKIVKTFLNNNINITNMINNQEDIIYIETIPTQTSNQSPLGFLTQAFYFDLNNNKIASVLPSLNIDPYLLDGPIKDENIAPFIAWNLDNSPPYPLINNYYSKDDFNILISKEELDKNPNLAAPYVWIIPSDFINKFLKASNINTSIIDLFSKQWNEDFENTINNTLINNNETPIKFDY